MQRGINFFLLFLLSMTLSYAGQPHPWQFNFQEAASPVMERIHHMHNILLIMLLVVAVVVFALLFYVMYRFRENRNPTPSRFSHNVKLEVVWTLIPTLMVLAIMLPSVRLLHFMDRTEVADLVIKAIGRQWYWSYEYPDQKLSFDSYMIQDKDLKPEHVRLLSVDNPIVVPVGAKVRLLVTGADVIHSFAVPALGVKQDAVPGRLRETWFQITKPGTYYGQCSELCGVNHGFMPIEIRAVSQEDYQAWLQEAAKKFAANPLQLAAHP